MKKKIEKFNDFKINELRNIGKMNFVNYGDRSIFESIVSKEVDQALKDWISDTNSNFVLIGGLALSFYVKPRYTMDIGVLFLSTNDIPDNVKKFKQHRQGAFQHNETHVEVETVTPKSINISIELAQDVFDTSEVHDGIRIASTSGMVALKLNRFSRQDQADIESLLKYTKIDLTKFSLSKEVMERFNKFKREINQ